MMILPMERTAAAPIPQKALAAMKLPILCARAHHPVVTARNTTPERYSKRRPKVSDSLPKRGCNDVDVSRNAVDSHDAELEALKYDVITGWLDAMSVESNIAIYSALDQSCDET
jgi:hypothetical protein